MKREVLSAKSCGDVFRAAPAYLTAGLILLFSLPALAGVEGYSSINYYKDGGYVSRDWNDAADTHLSYNSHGGGVWTGITLGPGESYSIVSGRADARNLTLGVRGQILNNNTLHMTDASITTELRNRLTVLPGNSGLVEGEVTTLTLKLRMDGSLSGEATSWPGKGWSSAEVSGGLTVRDRAIVVDTGEGLWCPPQASFGASFEFESCDIYKPVWGYSYQATWDECWRTESNIAPEDYHSDWGEITELAESFHYHNGRYFDTGERTLTFEVIVGHTLDFEADLYTYFDACNEAQTWCDFYNTFAFDVAPTVDGLVLNWEVVPEPASLFLLAAGALVLRRRSRRLG